mmetsp:Transcript_160242/g.295345  ORF Transcript_160242/g.295345 Transcript_160242/m.295345 type:complete len:105 (-) Transcript_160242:56-370(-)
MSKGMSTFFKVFQNEDDGKKEGAKKVTTKTKKKTTAAMKAYDTTEEYAALERLIKQAPWKKTTSSPKAGKNLCCRCHPRHARTSAGCASAIEAGAVQGGAKSQD